MLLEQSDVNPNRGRLEVIEDSGGYGGCPGT